MEFDKVLARVRKMVAMAEAPISGSATPEEREATEREQAKARKMADDLMIKWQIDEITAEAGKPAANRSKPGKIEVSVGEMNDIIGYVAGMCGRVARHTRCKVRHYTRYDREERQYYSTVYGFESDLHYFEVLYTTLRLHMLGALLPKPDPAKTLEENCWELHGAGFNWLEIADMYGWRKQQSYNYPGIKDPWRHNDTRDVEPATKVGSAYKRAYNRACKERGVTNQVIPAGGSKTYRKNVADGYLTRINMRMGMVERNRTTGKGIELKSRFDDVEQMFREESVGAYAKCPRCQKFSSNVYTCEFCGQFIKDEPEPCKACQAAASGHCRKHPKGRRGERRVHNPAAYQRGMAHADKADLTGNANGMPVTPSKPISR